MTAFRIEDSDLPPDLYHYTDAVGLKGILESQTLWGTHAAYLNDAQEIVYGKKKVVELLTALTAKQWSIPGELNSDDLWQPNASPATRWVECKALFVLFMAAIQSTVDLLQQSVGPFVACLSAVGDQLSQWRGYSGEGGYAIRFESSALKSSVAVRQLGEQLKFNHPSFTPLKIGQRHFVKMRYYADEEFIRGGMMEFFKDLLVHLAKNKRDDPMFDQQRFDRIAKEIIQERMTGILGMIMQMKNPGFAEENEYRIMTFAHPDFFAPQKIGLVPRVNIKFDPSCVKEIGIGPGANLDLRESSVRYFINTRPQYGHVTVSASKTPFRGT